MIAKFDNDDGGYLGWVAAHPQGYVLNIRARPDPTYIVLHRASCWAVGPRATVGWRADAYTGRDYRKVCGEQEEELRQWARTHGRPDGSFSSACKLCRPRPSVG